MDKQYALEKCKAIKDYLTTGNPMWDKEEVAEAMTMAIEALENDRPKGHWIWYEVRGQMLPYCSECGNGLDVIYEYDFCPDCGADMRGKVCEHGAGYEQAVAQLEHDMQYDPTYNPEDGSA